MKITISFTCILIMIMAGCIAQDSTIKSKMSCEFFFDIYFSYDFNKPSDHQMPAFLYNHNRHNEVNLNLGLARVFYSSKKTRATAGLIAGTYPEYNLSEEPQLLRHIYEASVGVKVSKKSNLWIDAGIFPSHIGFESAISKDCYALTRCISAENSPYYEAGIKGTFTSNNNKWIFKALLLNGWQRIRRPNGNNTIAFGTQITYRQGQRLMINYSSFTGNDKPDTAKAYRFFQSIYSIIEFKKYWAVTVGFDVGMEQTANRTSGMNFWYSPVIILRYKPTKTFALGFRTEYYSDKNSVIIPSIDSNKFQMAGFSLNIDKAFGQNLLWRVEGRFLLNKEPYFKRGQTLSRSMYFMTTSMAINF